MPPAMKTVVDVEPRVTPPNDFDTLAPVVADHEAMSNAWWS